MMLKILFFGRTNREEICEYDFILNEIIPKHKLKTSYFLSLDDVRKSEEEYEVLVYSCRDPQNYSWGYMPTYDEVLEVVLKTKPKIIIQLSDEFFHENLQEHNNLGNYCELFLRQHHHPNYEYTSNTLHIPLGYYNDFNLRNKKITKIKDRTLNWCFVGYKKADREECINKFSTIEDSFVSLLDEGQHHNVSKDDLIDIYLNTIFSPGTRGWTNLYPNRLYESSICGSIPIVVGSSQEILDTFKYEEDPPWIFSDSWDNAVEACKNLLGDLDKLQEMQDNILSWWNRRMNGIQEKVYQVLVENELIDHYWQNDEIFGENWFGYSNLYQNVVKRFPNGSKFVEVGSWKGRSSSCLAVEIANSKKDIDFYCVDTWEGSIEHTEEQGLSSLYDTFINNMKPVEKYYFPLKITSLEAAKKFEDNSLDFVFIDASHEYEDVKKDIHAWLPKVKPGGIFAGHDYYVEGYDWFPGVKKAVDECLDNFDVSDGCFIYYKPDESKLKNFPPINFISIVESEDRRNLLYKKFEQYGLSNITAHIFERYEDGKYSFTGDSINNFIGMGRGPVTSHLRAIKDWYFTTDEEYAFFCEDDLSFETVKYWNFSWDEFFNKLPSDWGCVQLSWVREDDMFRFSNAGLKLRPRCWCDWSACAYLIKRSHAKKLISHYYKNGEFSLDYVGYDSSGRPDWALRPTVETIIFSNVSLIYGFPLFVEDMLKFKSTWSDNVSIPNVYSYHTIIEWWKNEGKNLLIDELIN